MEHKEHQKIIFDIITLVWQLHKPYLSRIPLKDADWSELAEKQGELSNYIKGRYGDNAVWFAAGIMVELAEYLRKEGKEVIG